MVARNNKRGSSKSPQPKTTRTPKKDAKKKESPKGKPQPQQHDKKPKKKKIEEPEPAAVETDSDSSESEESSSSLQQEEAPAKKAPRKTKPANKKTKTDDDESSEDDDEKNNSENDSDSDSDEEENDAKAGKKGYSDDNAKWLKPKKGKKEQLLSSSDEEDDDAQDEDASDDDDDDELLEVERQAQALDEELEAEQEEAAAEFQRTIAEETAIYQLPSAEDWATESEDRLVPPSELRGHIESILEVLVEFKARREPGRARTEYVQWLIRFASELHGYIPELVEYFVSMFSPNEAMEFLEASDRPRPLVIRTNTLKARRKDLAAALMKRGVTLDPLASWSKVGLKIVESPVPIGATPEYLSGHYMLQSAASMCPVLALNPQPKERILDVSAAPGGKTSYIAQLMRNTGVIVANDLKAERQKATVANLHRLGVHNTITCTHDGRKLGHKYPNHFDRILLDAPCSGLGVISRDPSVKVQRSIEDVKQCAHLQKELLLAAIDALKINKAAGNNHKATASEGSGSGTMVYSTCSVSVYENEEVVNYALQKRDIKIVDAGLEFGKSSLDCI